MYKGEVKKNNSFRLIKFLPDNITIILSVKLSMIRGMENFKKRLSICSNILQAIRFFKSR